MPLPRPRRRSHRESHVVMFVQPYVPAYRVPLFDELVRRLAVVGLELEVAHGGPNAAMSQRADERSASWSIRIKARRLRVAGRTLTYRSVLGRARHSRIVVAELASTNLDTYLLALDPRVRLMLWGHGGAYVTDPSRLDARLELWLARRAEHVFVYTEGGAATLRSRGYDPARITVVRNSTDTVALRAAADRLTAEDVSAFRLDHALGDGPIAAFVGSFDESKLLPLLFDAAILVQQAIPAFQLIVAGAGPEQSVVDAAAARHPFVRALPRVETDTLAAIGRVASCMVIPGRVGLVAVDALALGLPVVTTTFRHHAPEAEYLTADVQLVSDGSAEDLARHVMGLLLDPARLAGSAAAARSLGDTLTIEGMANAFARTLAAAAGQPVPDQD